MKPITHTQPNKLKVVVLDDHPIVLWGVKLIIQESSDFEVVEVFSCYDKLKKFLELQTCDIVITDFSFPECRYDGLNLVRKVSEHAGKATLVVLTGMRSSSLVLKCLDFGVKGVLDKMSTNSDLINCLHTVSRGKTYVSDYFRSDEKLNYRELRARNAKSLSPRELEVVRLLSQGLSPTEVSSKLSRSIKTISWTKIAAKRKLGVSSDAELFLYSKALL